MACNKKDILDFLMNNQEQLKQEFSVEKIGLFGSYARGEATDDSDIDVVVELGKPDMFCLIGIKQTLEEIFGRRVDVVRWRKNMNPTLRRRIEKDAIYV
jgi:predicted nucleotidyltransferase